MLRALVGSRGFVSIAGVLVLALVSVAGYFVVYDPTKPMRSYCAILPDAIGLYPNNHVTIRGIPVGTVSTIAPHANGVRVDFEVDARWMLQGKVSATTVSNTVVADRNLAVLTKAGTGDWDPGTCITDTLTPKSLTETVDALGRLSADLTGNSDPAELDRLKSGLASLDAATTGTGPEINALIRKLGSALDSPAAAIGHIGGLIDALDSLSGSTADGWQDIKLMLLRFAEALTIANKHLLADGGGIVDNLRIIIPWFNDITRMFGTTILTGLDATVPLVRLLGANVGGIQQIIGKVPAITSAFARAVDPQTGITTITYAPPTVALPSGDADRICAGVNELAPGRCASAADGLAHVQLAQLVLGMAGTR